MNTPAQLYHPSPRAMPNKLLPLEYPDHNRNPPLHLAQNPLQPPSTSLALHQNSISRKEDPPQPEAFTVIGWH
jgi:hypothetical protein